MVRSSFGESYRRVTSVLVYRLQFHRADLNGARMATNQKGPRQHRISMAARSVALACAMATLAACAAMPTSPETKLHDWEGEPVVTTSQNCGAGGCAVRATKPATP
jgi:hypothetical protein